MLDNELPFPSESHKPTHPMSSSFIVRRQVSWRRYAARKAGSPSLTGDNIDALILQSMQRQIYTASGRPCSIVAIDVGEKLGTHRVFIAENETFLTLPENELTHLRLQVS